MGGGEEKHYREQITIRTNEQENKERSRNIKKMEQRKHNTKINKHRKKQYIDTQQNT